MTTDPTPDTTRALVWTADLVPPNTTVPTTNQVAGIAAELAVLRRDAIDDVAARGLIINPYVAVAAQMAGQLLARFERDRAERAALSNDMLDIRGLLAPAGQPPIVPPGMLAGPAVAPSVEWLLADRRTALGRVQAYSAIQAQLVRRLDTLAARIARVHTLATHAPDMRVPAEELLAATAARPGDDDPRPYLEEFWCWVTPPGEEDHEHDWSRECDWGWRCNLCGRRTDGGPCPDHAPLHVPGLRLVGCTAEPRHWLFGVDAEDYGMPCWWCAADELQDKVNELTVCRHWAWRSWRITYWVLRRLPLVTLVGSEMKFGNGHRGCLTDARWRWRWSR